MQIRDLENQRDALGWDKDVAVAERDDLKKKTAAHGEVSKFLHHFIFCDISEIRDAQPSLELLTFTIHQTLVLSRRRRRW